VRHCQEAAQPTQFLLHRAAQIEHKMKAIGNLRRLWSAAANAVGIRPVAIATDHRDSGACREPLCETVRRACRQQIDDTPALQIHEDRAEVVLPFSPRPVIDADDPNDVAAGHVRGALFDAAQNGVIADRQAEAAEQSFATPSTQRVADQLNHVREATRVSRVRTADAREPFREYPRGTSRIPTAPPADVYTEHDGLSLRRQVFQCPPIAAVASVGPPTTRGTARRGLCRCLDQHAGIRR
jgi:hypothetical protein